MKRTLLPRKTIGLDLGGYSLKAVILRRGPWGAGLSRAVSYPAPEPGPDGRADSFYGDVLGDLPKAFHRSGGVGLGLDGGRAFYRRLDLPKLSGLSKAKKRAAASFALEKDLPVGLEDLAVDVGRWLKPPSGGSRGLVFGLGRSLVEDILERLREADLAHRFISLDTLGLLTAAEVSGCVNGVVMDLGHSKTTILCLREGRVEGLGFSEIAGAELEKHLVRSQGIEPGQAGARKEAIGSPEETERLFGPILENLAREAGRIIKSAYPEEGTEPRTLHLCGGTSRLPGLAEFLGRGLSLETGELNPLRRPVEPEMIPAVGLALSDTEFDLGRELTVRSSAKRPVALALIALAAALVLGGANLYQAVDQRRTKLEALVRAETRVIKQAAPQLTRIVSPLRQLKTELNKAKEELDSLKGGKSSPVIDILADLERLASAANIKLSEVVIDGSKVTLSGRADSFDTLSKFQRSLANEGGFGEVKRQSGKLGGGSAGVRFSLGMKR